MGARCRQEMDAKQATEEANMLAYQDELEKEDDELEPSHSPNIDVRDMSDDKN